MAVVTGLYERAASRWRELQAEICAALEAVDGRARFSSERWERPGGGGGVSRVLEDGEVFEKAGVNWSDVEGELPEDFAAQLPGSGRRFRATGVSLVLHPRSPMVPTTHANFRFLEKGWREDAEHFHRALAAPRSCPHTCRSSSAGAPNRTATRSGAGSWCDADATSSSTSSKTFGLKTGGRIESILMSLPPLVRWDHDVQPPGPRERELVDILRAPVDWLGR